jgi:L-ascorbate metabolism protein UlaG (beta-lactamase superfamily)
MQQLRVRLGIIGVLLILGGQAVAGYVEVLWLGHATVKLTSVEGKVIVIDPFLKKNPKTPKKFKNLKAIGKVDVILLTHGHGDHIADVSELAKLTSAKVVANAALVRQLVAVGALSKNKIIAMNKSGIIKPIGNKIKIHMVRAEHSSSLSLSQLTGDKSGNQKIPAYVYAGEPVGYVIEFENGFKIYHSGDTGIFGDMTLIGEYYKPDVAMISIGGVYTMDGEIAGYAMKELMKPKTIIPIHYGTYPKLTGSPSQLRKALGKSSIQVLEVRPGENIKF